MERIVNKYNWEDSSLFEFEKQIEKDMIEDTHKTDLNAKLIISNPLEDSLAVSWVNPIKPEYDADIWHHDDKSKDREWNKLQYVNIQAEGTSNDFDNYWNEKIRHNKK